MQATALEAAARVVSGMGPRMWRLQAEAEAEAEAERMPTKKLAAAAGVAAVMLPTVQLAEILVQATSETEQLRQVVVPEGRAVALVPTASRAQLLRAVEAVLAAEERAARKMAVRARPSSLSAVVGEVEAEVRLEAEEVKMELMRAAAAAAAVPERRLILRALRLVRERKAILPVQLVPRQGILTPIIPERLAMAVAED